MPTNTSVEADQLTCPPNTRTVVPRLEKDGAMTLGVVEGAESLAQCRCDHGSYLPDVLTRTRTLTLALTPTPTLTLTRCDDGYYLPNDQTITTTAGCEACPPGAVCRGTYFPPIAMVGYGKVTL